MPNTRFKVVKIPARIKPGSLAHKLLSFPSPLLGTPWAQGARAADHVPAAHRTLLLQHTGGGDSWLVPDTEPAHPQTHPEAGTWRLVVPPTRASLAPGCGLELRVIAVRSGFTERQDPLTLDWGPYGIGGRVKLVVDYENANGDTRQVEAEVELAPSPQEFGAEPATPGGTWAYLLYAHRRLPQPDTPAELAKFSEDTLVTMSVYHQGGARVVQVAVSEYPAEHVAEHDTDNVSVHGWPMSLQGPSRPQTKAPDGATYEEHRQGTLQAMAVARRQSQRLGPFLAQWTSYTEGSAAVSDLEPPGVAVTSTSFVGLSVGQQFVQWSTDAPGYAMAGHYAKRSPEHWRRSMSGTSVSPVRIWVDVRWSALGFNTGRIRWQSTSRSWVDIKVDQAVVGTDWTTLTITGFLESKLAIDDHWPNLMDFAKVTGGTMLVRQWSIQWGDHAVP